MLSSSLAAPVRGGFDLFRKKGTASRRLYLHAVTDTQLGVGAEKAREMFDLAP
jgi:hypothetical protein